MGGCYCFLQSSLVVLGHARYSSGLGPVWPHIRRTTVFYADMEAT